MSVLDLLPQSQKLNEDGLHKFGRTSENLQDDLESIKEWCKKQPHLPEIPSDNYITAFLFLSNFAFAKAKIMVDTYYSVRVILPEIFKDPEDPAVLTMKDLLYVIPLPNVTSHNSRILVFKMRTKIENQPYDAYAALIVNFMDILLVQDYGAPKTLIIDYTNLQMEHLSLVSPLILKKIYNCFEKIYTGSIHQIHIINAPAIVEPFIAVLKSIVKPRTAEKFYIHKNLQSLQEYVSKEYLPQDYGGVQQSLETLHGLWKNKLKDFVPTLRRQNLLKTDESKRPADNPLASEVLGVEGNFRKLDVD